MTLQQLEYILALDKTRHFVRAAEMCGVTQPTLSAMVQKLEDELDCRIFDRSSHPIVPTSVGETIIRKAQTVLFNVNQLKESVLDVKRITFRQSDFGHDSNRCALFVAQIYFSISC